jgi:archaellum component FlaD/FlaE
VLSLDKNTVILTGTCTLLAFAAGWYATPTKTVTVTKTVEVEKKTETSKTDQDKKEHKDVTIVEVTKPDGSKEKRTEVRDSTETSTQTNKSDTDQRSTTTEQTKEVTAGGSTLTLSLLGGVYVTSPEETVYGGAVTHKFIGPLSLGVFGMSNKTGGLVVSLNF